MAEDGLDLEGKDPPAEGLHAVPEPPPAEPGKPKPRRRKSPGRPATATVSSELKGQIAGPLNELAEWLESRDEELAGTLRDSAPRIAEFLAVHAAKRPAVARLLRSVFAKGGPFAALRAFGPLARAVGERLGARRQTVEPEPVPEPIPEPPPDGPVLPDA